MKRKWIIFFLVLGVFAAAEKVLAEESALPERYKKWLEEEVVYIIAPLEREVFLKLKTDRERDLFLEAFWKHRDPIPETPENEFKKEHYRRINYANHFFGRVTPKPGWKTDRGRIYIILGEPNDIQRYEGKTQTYASVVWFYQGKTNMGLPPGFRLLFFQGGGTGEYELYSPLRDGPQALLTSYYGDPLDYLSAYEHLRELEPDLAEVSLSLIPGERSVALDRPTMSSDILMQNIEMTPLKQVEEKYAQKFLEYKDIVEVEYSANYIGNDSLVKVFKDASGLYFVHYAIEPERLSVNLIEDKYYTTLRLNGTVSDMEGKVIYQFEKNISLEFDKEQIREISHKPMSIRDMFPLIPGNFKMSVLLKNEASKEFTSLERDLLIPGDESVLHMTSIILGYRMRENIPEKNRLRPFQSGKYQIYFQANRVFLRQDELAVAFQIHGLTQALKERGEIRYVFMRSGEAFWTFSRRISEYPDVPNFLEKFSLSDFPPAHYWIQVAILADGHEVIFESEEFDVTHSETIPRPWIYAKLMPDTADPIYSYTTGSQLFNRGKTEEARIELEKAYRANPDSIDFALSLVRAHMALAEFGNIESILLPFLNKPQPPEYEAYFLLGKTYQNLGELSKAIDIFDKAISHYGLNINLLNSIGECHFILGNKQDALSAWEKSVEINPNQPQIRKNIESIKEKK